MLPLESNDRTEERRTFVNRLIRVLVSSAALACPLNSPLAAQEVQRPAVTEGTVFDPHLGIERPWVKLRGEALPTFIVIEHFFYGASSALADQPETWNGLLRLLDIQPGSGADSALREATLAARESVLFRPPDEPPPAWAAVAPRTADDHVALKRGMVTRLAKIYASLLVDLAEQSYDIGKLYHYLEHDVRSSSSVTMHPEPGSTDNLDARVLEEERRFDQLLIEALATESAQRSQGGGR